MQRKQMWFAALGAAVVLSAACYAGNLWATPAKGFSATTLALGRFGDIEVFNHFIQPSTLDEDEKRIWLSWQKTKGESDLYVQNNVWAPGGSTGWHSHPGHSLIIVTAGTGFGLVPKNQICLDHSGAGRIPPTVPRF